MESIREQIDVTDEISNAISHPVGMATQVDEVGSIVIFRFTGMVLTARTNSRPNWKRSNRKNWTNDSPVPNAPHLALQLLQPALLPPVENVSLPDLFELDPVS